jgi:hypothetical protein
VGIPVAPGGPRQLARDRRSEPAAKAALGKTERLQSDSAGVRLRRGGEAFPYVAHLALLWPGSAAWSFRADAHQACACCSWHARRFACTMLERGMSLS